MAGPYYASRSDGSGGILCGCPICSVGKFGEVYNFDTSGILVCACVETPGGNRREFRNVVMPTHFELTHGADSPARWFAPPDGSAELWAGTNCGTLNFIENGKFTSAGTCTDSGLSQQIDWIGDVSSNTFSVYGSGIIPFTALGQSRPNSQTVCGFLSYFTSGDGTITAP